jgi:hypothetical protein
MKRRWWIVLGLAGVAAIVAISGIFLFSDDRVTDENFAKIDKGMTEADVVQILGQPDDAVFRDVGWPELSPPRWCKTWRGSRMTISFDFTEDGLVDLKSGCTDNPDTTVGRIREWLGVGHPRLTPYRIHGGVGPGSSSI